MRTDSVNLSEYATASSKDAIIQMMGERYVHPRHFETKTKGAQEAHEAIRPTYMENQSIEGTAQEKKLYDLIWKRTIASQMADAELEKTTATISISKTVMHSLPSAKLSSSMVSYVYTVSLMTMRMNRKMRAVCCLL